MYVFGGVDKQTQRFNDLNAYDFLTGKWETVPVFGPPPCKRTFHKAIAASDNMYLFGGYNGKDRLRDTYKIFLGELSAPTLQHLCAEVIRKNYRRISNFEMLPPTIIETVIWTRYYRID